MPEQRQPARTARPRHHLTYSPTSYATSRPHRAPGGHR